MNEENTVNNEQPSVSGGEAQEQQSAGAPVQTTTQQVTQGVRTRVDGARQMLQRAARAASKTGHRADVHEYMRLRRRRV